MWRKLWSYYRRIFIGLPTPDKPWESISMDYLSGLPSTKHSNECVLVVVDIFSKMAILASCKKSVIVEDYPTLL